MLFLFLFFDIILLFFFLFIYHIQYLFNMFLISTKHSTIKTRKNIQKKPFSNIISPFLVRNTFSRHSKCGLWIRRFLGGCLACPHSSLKRRTHPTLNIFFF